MEQKRTLWIALASGLFLLVVIGVMGLYGYNKKKDAGTTLANNASVWTAPPQTTSQSSHSYTPQNEPFYADEPGLAAGEPAPSGGILPTEEPAAGSSTAAVTQTESVTVIANGTTNVWGVSGVSAVDGDGTVTIDLNTLKGGLTTQSVTAQNKAAETAAREANAAVASATPAATPAQTATPAASSAKSSGSSPATASASGSAQGQKAASPSTASGASTAKPATASTARPADKFWVQAASYASKKNADEARSVLDDNGIQCEVFTYTDPKGTLFYRVRVGPYTTKSEAEYWKQRIDGIELFAQNGTYVTNSSAQLIAQK